MYSVILCGGSGTRLWPLSRKNFPKQFLKLYSDKSLLQETFSRIQKAMPAKNIYLVTNQDNYFNVFNQILEIYPEIKKEQIIIEPKSLNTAPAILLAVKYLLDQIKINSKDPIIFLPADHYIGQPEKFIKVVKSAMKKINNNIGTIGIKPLKPETGFGYIEKGEKLKGYYKVSSFKEKPNSTTAKGYLDSGNFAWNSGMYLFNIDTFKKELKKHEPKLLKHLDKDYEKFIKTFSNLKSESIDTAVSEKSKSMIVFEGDFGWSDIGSFDALSEIKRKIDKKHIFLDSKNVNVHSDSGKMIAALGINDINIIESNDVILVQKKGKSEDVKKIVNCLKENKRKEVEHNVIVYRPWGKYEVLVDNAKNHKVKKITVFPGASLSLQSHEQRSEHWVVVKGTAKAINGENILTLHENESTYISAKTKHRLSNPGNENLEIIEVQTGSYVGEDDIVRYEDNYNRS